MDKDILFPGNKVYSPETCVFVTQEVNKFLTDSGATRGQWPVGVTYHRRDKIFEAKCQSGVEGLRTYLGRFSTPEEAHEAWRKEKLRLARILASEQTDERVAKALIERYENFRG